MQALLVRGPPAPRRMASRWTTYFARIGPG